MSKNIQITNIELNSDAIQELLKSDEIRTELEAQAEKVRNRLPAQGYGIDYKSMSSRGIVSVYTATEEAMRNEYDNNSLIKALK